MISHNPKANVNLSYFLKSALQHCREWSIKENIPREISAYLVEAILNKNDEMDDSLKCGFEDIDQAFHCSNCPKRKLSLFNELGKDDLTSLNSEKYEVRYGSGELIYKQGMKSLGLICLHQGKVKIERSGSLGNNQIVGLKKEGDFIGLRALMGRRPYSNSAVTLENTTICIIPQKQFMEVLKKNIDLSLSISEVFINELEESERLRVEYSQKHMRARLADALLTVKEVYGIDEDSGQLRASLKRAEIAALANMTTANAIRMLSSLAAEKVIAIRQRNIQILNAEALNFISLSGR